MDGLDVRPVTDNSVMYRSSFPLSSRSRVMLSSQTLCPIQASFAIRFMLPPVIGSRSAVEYVAAECVGVLEPAAERVQEPGRKLAFDEPVVSDQGQPHHLPYSDAVTDRDRRGNDARHREYRRFAGIDDGAELVDAKHPEVRDCEGPARHVVGRKRAVSR